MFTFSTRTEALSDPHRVPVLDYWRAIAILAVVIFHVGYLPYGYLGVDLFFVLSGYLVSRTLFQGEVHFFEVKNFGFPGPSRSGPPITSFSLLEI